MTTYSVMYEIPTHSKLEKFITSYLLIRLTLTRNLERRVIMKVAAGS